MSKSQRLPTLLALAAAAAISAGGVAAACPESFTSPSATTTPHRNNTASYHISYVSMREPRPSLLERLGEFALLPFAVGYGVTTILGRRGRRRRRRHDEA
jgi:hypothetical protein